MKVGNISSVQFRSFQAEKKTESNINNTQLKELSSVTPDFAISVPQKYKSLGVQKTDSGLILHSYKLANGYRVTIIPMEDSPTIVKNYVNVGSLNETDNIKGISHFLEHMAFNGTNGSDGYLKLNQGDSFKKIEQLGGWSNASTNYALTDYVTSTPLLEKNDLEIQLQVIAAMSDDLALCEDMILKEKGPVSSEIDMILDNPQTILMDETVRSLFNITSSADELVGGSIKHIQNLSRDDVKTYYDKYYTPDNMNLVITGDIDPQTTIELIAKLFKSKKITQDKRFETPLVPLNNFTRKDLISDKTNLTNIMLGFSGPKNNDTKSKIIFEILNNYLFSSKIGLSKELQELNASTPFLGCEKVGTNQSSPLMLYYEVECANEKKEETLKVLLNTISNLKPPNQEDLEQIKEKLIQNHKNSLEYSLNVNTLVGSSIFDGNLDYLTDYENIVNDITTDDVQNFIDNHFDLNKSALTVINPQTTEIAFKGVNKSKQIEVQKLENNFKIGFQQTKNDNTYFSINLYHDIPNINPAIKAVLANIYQQNLQKDEYLKFSEENNLAIDFDLHKSNLEISGYSGNKNFEKTVDTVKEILNNPEITQQFLDKAISQIKENLELKQDTSKSLYKDYESNTNPYYTSTQDILDGLEQVRLEDVKELHNYILENSSGTISMNIPSNNNKLKEIAIKNFETLSNVKDKDYELIDVYKPNSKTVILTKERNMSQADIMQTYKYEWNNTSKEHAISRILNTILTQSSSIGLFNTLREKEHLAYTVYSNTNWHGNSGELSLNILTTTDNKDIGETTYDNVQKSINGFNRQISELLNSQYIDEDLESAKRMLKADLLQKEGVWNKLSSVNRMLKYSRDIDSEIFNEIDNITRADIDKYAKKIFSGSPIYSITASKDTLENNKEFFNSLI